MFIDFCIEFRASDVLTAGIQLKQSNNVKKAMVR